MHFFPSLHISTQLLEVKSSAQIAIQFPCCHLRVFTMTNVDLNSNNAVLDAQEKKMQDRIKICIQKSWKKEQLCKCDTTCMHICVYDILLE